MQNRSVCIFYSVYVSADLGRRRFGAPRPALTERIRAKHPGGYPRML
jgi:hypothetical protein